MAKTTNKHFQSFVRYALHWQRELGLDDYHLYIYHEKTPKGIFARTNVDTVGHGVTMQFADNWGSREISEANIESCALHEVLHVMTARLFVEAKNRYSNDEDINDAEHAIVTRITNYIMRTSESSE